MFEFALRPTTPKLVTHSTRLTLALLAVFFLFIENSAHALTCSMTGGYLVKNGEVYFSMTRTALARSEDVDVLRVVPGVDVATFKPSLYPKKKREFPACVENYAKDKYHVYYEGERIEGAMPGSYALMDHPYARDAQNVFVGKRLVSKRSNKFVSLGLGYASDGEKYFYNGEVLNVANLTPIKWGYAKSTDHLYFRGEILLGIDPESFDVWQSGYQMTRDKNHVYYKHQPIPNADPKSIKLIRDFYFADNQSVYFEGLQLIGLNPIKAKVSDRGGYIFDDAMVFRGSRKLNRDALTFAAMNHYWSKDKDAVYFKDEMVPGADPVTFDLVFNEPSGSPVAGQDANFRYLFGKVECKLRASTPGDISVCQHN